LENAMTITSTTFERCMRSALLATLSATLLAACGGGDPDVNEPVASATPTLKVEKASAQASRKPGGGDVRPIFYCMDALLTCPPTLPPAN
jgi:hypothetical protein